MVYALTYLNFSVCDWSLTKELIVINKEFWLLESRQLMYTDHPILPSAVTVNIYESLLEKYKGWMAVILKCLLQANFAIVKEKTFSGTENK